MSEWLEAGKLIAQVVGALGLVALGGLYHKRAIAIKDLAIDRKSAELDRVTAELNKTLARGADAERLRQLRAGTDLSVLRDQLATQLERIAKAMQAQAASLYIPVYSLRDEAAESPRGFAFVVVYNADTGAAKAIRDMRLVESWGIVGECWDKGAVLCDNDLQANVRHMASYDKKSGFVAMHTLLAPVRFNNRQIAVLQLLNKAVNRDGPDLDLQGFNADDRKGLALQVGDRDENSLAMLANYFVGDPNYARFLGVQDELDLENAVIMFADLTKSASLFSELPLLDAARLINRFEQEVYRSLQPFAPVIEKFNGDGTMIRFHYGGFEPGSPESNPAFRAICAAMKLVSGFDDFKARQWKLLADTVAHNVKLRVTIALGPVISMNVGPRQFQVPTVLGQCVNRAAKMSGFAPRDRSLILLDDNVRKALLQLDRDCAEALRETDELHSNSSGPSPSLAGHTYYELDLRKFSSIPLAGRSETLARKPLGL